MLHFPSEFLPDGWPVKVFVTVMLMRMLHSFPVILLNLLPGNMVVIMIFLCIRVTTKLLTISNKWYCFLTHE